MLPITVAALPECEAVSLVPPLLALLFPERPRSRAFRLRELLSAFEALPSNGVPSLPASAAPVPLAFFTSLLLFFNLSCADRSRSECSTELWTHRAGALPLRMKPWHRLQQSSAERHRGCGCQSHELQRAAKEESPRTCVVLGSVAKQPSQIH